MSGDHDHGAVTGSATSPLAARIRAMGALPIEKGALTEAEVQENIAYMDSRSAANGARLVARAWTDEDFKGRLLADGKAAAVRLGIDVRVFPDLLVVANTSGVQNLIVCTLCSCYPRAVLREFGLVPPKSTRVIVHDSTADVRYIVLPMRPPGTDGIGEELPNLVTRDALIGTGVPKSPAAAQA